MKNKQQQHPNQSSVMKPQAHAYQKNNLLYISKKIVLATTLSLALFSCGGKEEKPAEAPKPEAKPEALVSVTTVKDTIFSHYLDIQGNVDTKENLVIYPQYSGTLLTLNVVAGQKVKKGQVLGRIDDGGLGQQLAQLQTQAALAKTTYERQKRLWDQKIGSEIQFLQAQTNWVAMQKQVSQMRAQVARTILTAPIAGTVDEIMTDRGQVVAPGQGVMRIVNLVNMYVSAEVPEAYVGKINVGTPVDVELPSLGKTYTGKVRQVASNINPNNRSFGIEINVPNDDKLLRPNQVAKLKIVDYTNPEAVIVPSNVVLQDASGDQYVYVVTDATDKTGVARKTPIKVGKTSNSMTEVISGLTGGEIVVTEGANAVSDGMKLNF
jgi:membrane fusion protein, multidrug efflux system